MKYSDSLAKKSLSQNFLNDPNILQKIKQIILSFLQLTKPENSDKSTEILEIGPGYGALTDFLLETNKRLTLIEIDPQIVDKLKQKYGHLKNLQIKHADAFELLEKKALDLDNFSLVSNLPYHLGSRILVELAINYPQTNLAVILQKEVVDKLFLEKAKFTFFGAYLNLFWDFKKHLEIKPGSFQPPPKVLSSLVTGKIKTLPYFLETYENRKTTCQVLKTLTAKPRKSLKNNLKLFLDPEQIVDLFKQNQWPETFRLNSQNYTSVLEKILQI